MLKLLITGGTGSFGSSALRRFLDDPEISEIVVFSRDEKKQHDQRQQYGSAKLRFIIGDIRDRDAINRACRGIDVVFHAAALKHVPSGEFFPTEVVKTNTMGTENLCAAAEANGVKKVVLLSTDKAVYPINAMGMSKAIAEKIIVARSRSDAGISYCAVRYGNVMASRGSVIPLFVERIKAGKSLPITNPNMTRFLLSLDDSIDLVKFAIERGESGDILIRKAPAATLETLAKAAMNIFGVEAPIEIVGTREGEKIHETLMTGLERARAEEHENYFRIRNTVPRLSYEPFFERGTSAHALEDYTSENTARLTVKETEILLRGLEYIQDELKSYAAGYHWK